MKFEKNAVALLTVAAFLGFPLGCIRKPIQLNVSTPSHPLLWLNKGDDLQWIGSERFEVTFLSPSPCTGELLVSADGKTTTCKKLKTGTFLYAITPLATGESGKKSAEPNRRRGDAEGGGVILMIRVGPCTGCPGWAPQQTVHQFRFADRETAQITLYCGADKKTAATTNDRPAANSSAVWIPTGYGEKIPFSVTFTGSNASAACTDGVPINQDNPGCKKLGPADTYNYNATLDQCGDGTPSLTVYATAGPVQPKPQ